METALQEQLDRIEGYVKFAAKEVLDVKDVAFFTGLSVSRIHQLCSQRMIPHYKQGKLYFKRKEIEAWLTSNRVPTALEVESKAILHTMRNKKTV